MAASYGWPIGRRSDSDSGSFNEPENGGFSEPIGGILGGVFASGGGLATLVVVAWLVPWVVAGAGGAPPNRHVSAGADRPAVLDVREYVAAGTRLNRALVRDGWAHVEAVGLRQAKARAAGRGMWRGGS